MSTTNYPEAMSAAQPDAPPASKLGWKWFALSALGAGASSLVFRAVHATGSVVLIVAAWAALVTVGVVSCRRFVKREQRRREASGI